MLRATDRKKLLFTDGEYKSLLAYSTMLDDELKGKAWHFYSLFETLYKRALLRADSILNHILSKPIDLVANESITTSSEETFNFAADLPALSARWGKYLKYRALTQFFDMAGDDSTGKNSFMSLVSNAEKKVRERIRLAESKSLRKHLGTNNDFPSHVTQVYLNAIATGFDPHSNFFSPQERDAFKSDLSTESLSFGLELDENERGQIIITDLTPGGPAWKSGEINEGDELISLQWEGKEAIELTGLSLEDVYEILEESSEDRLVIKSRKQDGTVSFVFLRKEAIENDDNVVKGFVLKGQKKIGYIVLPAFYTVWENESGSSCANDVAKEIVKLKRENIDGLILDVRYNGGGSLGEAMELAGIFVDEGPLMGQKQQAGKVIFLRDPNRGTIYNGPMALMVNGQSASASELLAATLQDYNRAVIIGSHTFGKATMQQMMNLDTSVKKPTMTSGNKDVVKITTGKLYRLDGGTAQLNGVKPDIQLPDAFDALDYREKFFPTALQQDLVPANTYYKPLPALPIAELARRSGDRVSRHEIFAHIKKISAGIRARREKSEIIPLKSSLFEAWAKQYDAAELNEKAAPATAFSVDNHGLDKALLSTSEHAKEINSGWLQSIAKDLYIQETYSVVCDLIELQQHRN